MKKLYLTVLLLLSSIFSFSQILSGDFYYTSDTANKYELYLRLIRFCDNTTLSNTQQIRVIIPGDFRNVDLTRVSIKNVTGPCGPSGGCDPSNTNGTGKAFEEHIYKTTVDFRSSPFGTSTWTNACDVEFAFVGGSRSDAINTFTGASFYTTTKINKCLAQINNSPYFGNDMARYVCSTQPVRFSVKNTDVDGDSLSYEMVETKIHQASSVTYGSSPLCGKKFSATMPLTPFLLNPCGPHVPKPNLDPPQGFYFGNNGDVAFTPNNIGDSGVITYVVTEWRKDNNGVYKKIGESNREIFLAVAICPSNNSPKFTSASTYCVLPSSNIAFDITVRDDPVIPPPPATAPSPDTVYIYWDSGISNATFTVVDTSNFPIGKFSWTPTCNDASATPHTFNMSASDSVCPVPGFGSQTISIYVLEDIKGKLGGDRIFCGDSVTPFTLKPNIYGANYLWSDSSTADSLRITQPGIYWVEVTSPNCSFSSRDSILVDTTGNIVRIDKVIGACLPFNINIGNTYKHASYSWTHGPLTDTITVDTFGKYEINIFSTCGIVTQTFDLVKDSIEIDLGADITTCDTAGLYLNPGKNSNYTSYTWSTNETADSIKPTTFGLYWVEASHPTCGILRDSITLFKQQNLVNIGPDSVGCKTVPLILRNSLTTYPNSTIKWSDNSTADSLNVSLDGTYWLEINNPVCGIQRDSVEISFLTIPNINLGSDRYVNCKAISETLIIPDFGPTTTIAWSTGEKDVRDILVTEEGNFSVTATNKCGTSTDQINITDSTTFKANLGPDITYCNENFVSISGNFSHQPDSFLWNNSQTTSSINIVNNEDTLVTGTFWLQVNYCNKVARDTINLTFRYAPKPNIGADIATDTPFSIFLDAGVTGDSYKWNNNATTKSIAVNTLGTYWVDVTDTCGTGRDSARIYYISVSKPDIIANEITIYPNPSSGIISLRMESITADNIKLAVYTPQGQLVYQKPLEITDTKHNETIDLSYLAKGVYIMKLTSNKGVQTFEILIQ